jgi:hydrogenase maturation protease
MMNLHDDARDKHPGIIKIIGIGQSLRGDDAAGLAAVRLWQETYPENSGRQDLRVELAELPGIGLLDLMEGARLVILVDAVRSDAKPGTVHVLTGERLAAFTGGTSSAHGWGVAETLALGQQVMPSAIPERLILIGIEAGDIALGAPLSPEVESALPKAALLIEMMAAGN